MSSQKNPSVLVSMDFSIVAEPYFDTVKRIIEQEGITSISLVNLLEKHCVVWEYQDSNVIFGDQLKNHVLAIYKESDFTAILKSSDTLMSHIASLSGNYPDKTLTLAVQVANKKSLKQFNRAMLIVQDKFPISLLPFEDYDELADTIICITKAMIDKPEKQLRRNILGFDEKKTTTTVAKDDLGAVFSAQLEEMFSSAGPQLAAAVTKKYPSPRQLTTALQTRPVSSVFEKVTATKGQPPLRRTFCVGRESAHRIHQFFTIDDPDHLL